MTDLDKSFLEALLTEAPEVEGYQSSSPLLEQLIDNIVSEGGLEMEPLTKSKRAF